MNLLPRRDNEDDAERSAFDVAFEPRFVGVFERNIGER